MNRYRCDACGFYLYPVEGRTCDECQIQERQRVGFSKRVQDAIHADGAPWEFIFEEESA